MWNANSPDSPPPTWTADGTANPDANPTATTAPLKEAAAQAGDNASRLWDQFTDVLPQMLIAVLILVLGFGIGHIVRRYLRKLLTARYNIGFARVVSRLAMWGFLILVLLIAMAIAFPSVNMVSVISSLGFISVGVGFALKDIIENAFAGMLLMYRESFVVGDQIEVVGVFGDVAAVNVRETVIRQRDGQRIIIPNRDVYKNNIRIQTANELRRYEFKLEFDYNVDHHDVIKTLVDCMVGVEGVVEDPPPAGRIHDTDSEMVIVTLRGWTKSEQSHFNATRNRAIQKVITTMIEKGIPLPDAVVPIEVDSIEHAATSEHASDSDPATSQEGDNDKGSSGSSTNDSNSSSTSSSGQRETASGRESGRRMGDSRSGHSRAKDWVAERYDFDEDFDARP